MKVVHVPFCFFPDPVGGTELYVQSLARAQRQRGVSAIIAAPGSRSEQYEHDGLLVRRFGGLGLRLSGWPSWSSE